MLAANVPALGEVANFGTDYFLLKIKFLAKYKREFTTKFAILPNACCKQLCVLRCLRIRRYKSSLKRQHNFIRDDRLYEGSETSHAKKCGGLTKDFE